MLDYVFVGFVVEFEVGEWLLAKVYDRLWFVGVARFVFVEQVDDVWIVVAAVAQIVIVDIVVAVVVLHVVVVESQLVTRGL